MGFTMQSDQSVIRCWTCNIVIFLQILFISSITNWISYWICGLYQVVPISHLCCKRHLMYFSFSECKIIVKKNLWGICVSISSENLSGWSKSWSQRNISLHFCFVEWMDQVILFTFSVSFLKYILCYERYFSPFFSWNSHCTPFFRMS